MTARPAAKVVEFGGDDEEDPMEVAVRMAATLSARVFDSPARIRRGFIRRSEASGIPPLALLLRGGQGGEVRLKLYLTLLWAAGRGRDDRHKTRPYPARAWAELLALPDPAGNGQRRIRDAIQWLEEQQLIHTERTPGRPLTIQLRRDDASGKAYTNPGSDATRKKKSKAGFPQDDLYISLPPNFWTDGWIIRLSGRAIAMLLTLTDVTFTASGFAWIAPGLARQRYALSEDTWSKGLAELRAHDLVRVKKMPVGEDRFEVQRVRNTYQVTRDESGVIVLPEA
jgi:hypothetical protein